MTEDKDIVTEEKEKAPETEETDTKAEAEAETKADKKKAKKADAKIAELEKALEAKNAELAEQNDKYMRILTCVFN